MKNLAGVKTCDVDIEQELRAAGVPFLRLWPRGGEVDSAITGMLAGWKFTRAWYYWVARCENSGLPLDVATAFNAHHGSDVRCDGYAGGSPVAMHWRHSWQRADAYHIDTPEGLAAFVALLKEQHPDWAAAEMDGFEFDGGEQ